MNTIWDISDNTRHWKERQFTIASQLFLYRFALR